VLLITGLMPTFINANQQPFLPAADVRFFSLCNNLAVSPAPVLFCSSDQETALFPATEDTLIPLPTAKLFPLSTVPPLGPIPTGAKQYVYMVSDIRPSNLDANVTWIPTSTAAVPANATAPENLIIRNVLSNPLFANSIQRVLFQGNAAAAQLLASLSPPVMLHWPVTLFYKSSPS